MAQAFEVADHRDPRFFLYARHQALAAARDEDIEPPAQTRHHVADSGAIRRLHELDRIFRQARVREAGAQCRGNRAAGVEAFRAAAQDNRVGGAHAERASVGRNVGSALVDDADDANGSAHAADLEAVRPRPFRKDGSDRIGQRGDILDACRHRLDACRRKFQPVEQGRGQVFVAASPPCPFALAARMSASALANARRPWPAGRPCASPGPPWPSVQTHRARPCPWRAWLRPRRRQRLKAARGSSWGRPIRGGRAWKCGRGGVCWPDRSCGDFSRWPSRVLSRELSAVSLTHPVWGALFCGACLACSLT